jgi:hypothetical protein
MSPLLVATIVCFTLAALGGATLLTYVLRDKPTPKGIVFLHGPLAALAIVLLIVYTASAPQKPLLSLVLFVGAALGGFFLLYRDLAHGKVPKPIALVHGLIAITAFVLLLRFALT